MAEDLFTFLLAAGLKAGDVPGPALSPPVALTAPQIVGTTLVGSTLTIIPGTYSGNPDPNVSHLWSADGVPISTATGLTLFLDASYTDKAIGGVEIAANTVGSLVVDIDPVGPVGEAISGDPPYYIRKIKYGTGDASSWANAAAITQINNVIAAAAVIGGIVYVRADEGDYTVTSGPLVTISHGGIVDNPVTVLGVDVDLNMTDATFTGNRTSPWAYPGGTSGPEVFRLMAGADHLIFRHIAFSRCGNGCFRIGADIADLTLLDCTATNVYRFIENNKSGAALTAAISGLTVQRCEAHGFGRAFSRVQYDSHDILFEDCIADAERQDGENFCEGYAFAGTAHDVVMNSCEGWNIVDIVLNTSENYWNGDAFVTETGNYNFEFNDCGGGGCTDAVFDLKSAGINGGTVLNRCWGRNSKHIFRTHRGGITFNDCTGYDPYQEGGIGYRSQIEFTHTTGTVTVDGCSFVDVDTGNKVFDANTQVADPAAVVVTDTAVQTAGTETYNPDAISMTVTTHAAPANTVAPTISGTGVAGTVHTATPGTWDQTVTKSYAWRRDGVEIAATYASTYTPVGADVDTNLTLAEYGTNAAGDVGEVVSAPVAITGVQPTNTVAPSIGGFPYSGQKLTGNVGTWVSYPDATFTYRWLADDSAIGGATESTFTSTDTQIGAAIKFEVSGTNSEGGPIVATSAPTAAIGAATVLDFYVRPVAHGLGDGSSWANACDLGSVAGLSTTPGGYVYFRADEGSYDSTTVNITRSGASGQPVVYAGVDVDLNPMLVTIVGSRTEWTLPPTTSPPTVTSISGWANGSTLFQVSASYLTFQNFNPVRCQRPWDVKGVRSHLEWYDNDLYNTREGIYEDQDNYATDVKVHRWKHIGFSKKSIRAHGDANNWEIWGIEMDCGWQSGDDWPVGVEFNDTAHDVHIDGTAFSYPGTIKNCYNADSTTKYWNSDGIAAERNNDDILVENLTISGCSDAAIDMKATNVIVRNVTAINCKRNFKFWGAPVTLENCLSQDPKVWGGTGGGAHFTMQDCDILFKNTEARNVGSNYPGFQCDIGGGYDSSIIRQVGMTYTGVDAGSIALPGSLFLTDTIGNTTPPVMTNAATGSTYSNSILDTSLTSDKGASWTIVGGADAAQFSLLPLSPRDSAKTAHILRMKPQTYSEGGDNDRVVTVRASDANRNTANFDFTVTLLAGSPPLTMECNFEGANNATSFLTEEGRTVTCSSGAKLTTTSPLDGTSSLLLGGSAQRASIGDSSAWTFSAAFSILAQIRASSLAATGDIVSQYAASSAQRSFEFQVSAAGALIFKYSFDGNATSTLSSSAGLILANTTYEVAVDRDASNALRLYIDGAMVAKATVSSGLKNSGQALVFGNNASSNTPFVGRIDKARIWNGYYFCGSDSGYTP